LFQLDEKHFPGINLAFLIHWALISNDAEWERNRLLVQLSDDEGRTW
jgi:hypothetical protein